MISGKGLKQVAVRKLRTAAIKLHLCSQTSVILSSYNPYDDTESNATLPFPLQLHSSCCASTAAEALRRTDIRDGLV